MDISFTSFEELLTIEKAEYDSIVGVSELLFEVMYGAGDSLHSRANEVLSVLLTNFDRKSKQNDHR